jgi:PAS domain S-box-containing protein
MSEAPHSGDDFSSLFEFLPIGAYRSSPDGRQLRANPALARLNGFADEAEQLAVVRDIAREWYVDPGRRAVFRQALDNEGQVIGFESEVCRYKTRERIWVSENAHAVRDAAGQVQYYEGTVEEITERVLARQALARSEDNLRQVAAHVPGALYRLLMHPDGRRQIDYISEGVRTLLGLDPEAVMRELGAIRRLRHPDDVERVAAELDRANTASAPLLTEYRVRLADGSEKWVQQSSSPVAVRADGTEVRIGVLLDISERKRAEALLSASEARWKLALDSAGDGVWDWNIATGVETLSRRCLEMYGYADGELDPSFQALDERTHPDDVEAMHGAREDHFAGRSASYVNEHRIRCKDGSWKWVLARGMIIERDDQGRPLRMIGTHTDLTARKQADALRHERDRAAAADLAKSQFLSRVSHELRTPLNAILGFAQLLELDPGAGAQERQRGWVAQVLSSGRHLLALMDDILELSSAQTGQLPVRAEAVLLRPVVEESLAMLAGSAGEAGVAVLLDLPEAGALSVQGDRKRIKQIVSNLLSNAIKYNRRGGWVRVAAKASAESIALSIADSGPGLNAAQQARLFQPFERLGAQRGPVAGSGLGLALSRQLAEAMGGAIDVQSQPGLGSTFCLRLPPASNTH